MVDDPTPTSGDTPPGNGRSNGGGGNGGGSGGGGASGGADGDAQVGVLAQYVKDLSFENPGAPQSLMGMSENPDVEINVNVGATAISADEYEVSLTVNVAAKKGDDVLFVVELVYCGVFALTNLPAEHIQPMLLIECPRLLFPFVRNIVADATRDGGFPPLMIQPLDFSALYQEQQQDAAITAPVVS